MITGGSWRYRRDSTGRRGVTKLMAMARWSTDSKAPDRIDLERLLTRRDEGGGGRDRGRGAEAWGRGARRGRQRGGPLTIKRADMHMRRLRCVGSLQSAATRLYIAEIISRSDWTVINGISPQRRNAACAR